MYLVVARQLIYPHFGEKVQVEFQQQVVEAVVIKVPKRWRCNAILGAKIRLHVAIETETAWIIHEFYVAPMAIDRDPAKKWSDRCTIIFWLILSYVAVFVACQVQDYYKGNGNWPLTLVTLTCSLFALSLSHFVYLLCS